ncbi:SDR family oxidoreductase [Sandaracinus amylolyticus]|uniref:Oxidoreductase, short-chain dehydrogenase/reductase family n=1 Tax=Sandaracinus amylolyticus TaxID=927083 RepID=A0A0F6W1H0_9BACT|nr:SDR family oxidoreductase [Sandaracinus amylolyticus]AKF05093.1 Oxidoreductase, short-chain dehydrogenase/reductase family [Sandaracinus amylolyticus]
MKSIFRDDVLEKKVAFVTGGGSGICKGIARAYLAHGARVAIVGRKADRLEDAARELSSETGRECVACPADVRNPQEVEGAIEKTLDRFGTLDVVVNGAAGNFLAPAAQLSYNAFRTVVEIDTLGTWNVSKAAFQRHLRDHGGHIVNITATLHYAATPMQAHASAAKAGVDAITRSLALEWGQLGIQVNGIAPGPIADTEGLSRLAPPGYVEKLVQTIPLRRLGRIDDVASCAVWLVSGAASYVHGETIVVDGGAWLPGMGGMMSF